MLLRLGLPQGDALGVLLLRQLPAADADPVHETWMGRACLVLCATGEQPCATRRAILNLQLMQQIMIPEGHLRQQLT